MSLATSLAFAGIQEEGSRTGVNEEKGCGNMAKVEGGDDEES
jgi:hypothetical protein